MPQYRVSYFNGRGRAEVMRQILSFAGQEFEDRRLEGEEWQKLKPGSFKINLTLPIYIEKVKCFLLYCVKRYVN